MASQESMDKVVLLARWFLLSIQCACAEEVTAVMVHLTSHSVTEKLHFLIFNERIIFEKLPFIPCAWRQSVCPSVPLVWLQTTKCSHWTNHTSPSILSLFDRVNMQAGARVWIHLTNTRQAPHARVSQSVFVWRSLINPPPFWTAHWSVQTGTFGLWAELCAHPLTALPHQTTSAIS